MKYIQIICCKSRNLALIIALMWLGYATNAQNWDRIDVDFKRGGQVLINSGMNGLVAPQFANYDFNGDGLEDVLVFDRASNTIMPFVWESGGEEGRLRFDYSYAANFPPVRNFVRFVDYDRDGDRDIFTLSQFVSGIEVWQNKGTDENPDFQLVLFPDYVTDANVLYYTLNGGFTPQVYVASTDIPVIADIDDDGDVDVLSFEEGGSYIYSFINQQVELGLPIDSLMYSFGDICWGKIYEAGNNSEVSLDDDGSGCGFGFHDGKNGGGERHAGSTLEVFDGDGDGDLDLLVGDLLSSQILYLTNGRNNDSPWMTEQTTEYPNKTDQVDINTFISAFYVDVNADGKKDLVASTNNRLGGQNSDHIWMYENVSSSGAPEFEFRTKNFLRNTSLGIPQMSKPAFVDLNNDGLEDILVGSFGYLSPQGDLSSRIFHYENTGTAEAPEYTERSDDYLGFSSFGNLSDLHPTAGDIDNDGDLDLLVGSQEGNLFFFENIAGVSQPAEFSDGVLPYFEIDEGKKSKPQIIDLNQDGLADILIGKRADTFDETTMTFGGVSFFPNVGSEGSPLFEVEAEDKVLGDIYTRKIGFSSAGNSAPVAIPTKLHDDFIFLVGSDYGEIYHYENVIDHLTDSFDLVTDSIPIPKYGRESGLSLADIDNDNYYEMVVGNFNGGLAFHNTPFEVALDSNIDDEASELINLYPNPTNGRLTIEGVDIQGYSLYSMDGRLISTTKTTNKTIDLSRYAEGAYHIQLQIKGKVINQKVILIK